MKPRKKNTFCQKSFNHVTSTIWQLFSDWSMRCACEGNLASPVLLSWLLKVMERLMNGLHICYIHKTAHRAWHCGYTHITTVNNRDGMYTHEHTKGVYVLDPYNTQTHTHSDLYGEIQTNKWLIWFNMVLVYWDIVYLFICLLRNVQSLLYL